jgi:hypothetical protein
MFSDLEIRLSHLRGQRNGSENRELELDIERVEAALNAAEEIEKPLGKFPGAHREIRSVERWREKAAEQMETVDGEDAGRGARLVVAEFPETRGAFHVKDASDGGELTDKQEENFFRQRYWYHIGEANAEWKKWKEYFGKTDFIGAKTHRIALEAHKAAADAYRVPVNPNFETFSQDAIKATKNANDFDASKKRLGPPSAFAKVG